MNIIPSIDIIDGKCVRLMQGDFSKKSIYPDSPADMARRFREAGATSLHIVDLEGSKNGCMTQLDTVAAIVKAFEGIVQVGGGIRKREDIARLKNMGVDRAVIGTRAISADVGDWITQFGAEAIVLALDFHSKQGEPRIAIAGWTEATTHTVWELLAQWPSVMHVLCTDIGRDGMQQGPNRDFYGEFMRRYPHIALQASGGVGSMEDIRALAGLGVRGAVIGKAIYENKISLEEAIRCLK